MEKFKTLYRESVPKIKNISRRYSKSSGIPEDVFNSALSVALWKCYKKYRRGEMKASFSTYCNTALRNAAVDVTRSSHRSYYQNVEPLDENGGEDEGAPTPKNLAATDSLEESVFKRKKNEADQRQLIDHILESAEIHYDPMAMAVVKGLMEGETVNSIAKSVGVHHSKVQRLLKRLARYYDVERFGDIRQYMPDGFEIKRDYIGKATA